MDNGNELAEARPRGSLEFVEASILDILVPAFTDFDIQEAVRAATGQPNDEAYFSHIAQRQALFFDETVDVYVILRTPYFDETLLRSYLARLAIVLDVRVVNLSPEGSNGTVQHESIFSSSVEQSEEPLLIVHGGIDNEDDELDGHISVIWKLPVFLSRPLRLRPQNPSIHLSTAASLKSAEQMDPAIRREEYMPSQIPSGMNLLESFANDPALGGIKPQLSGQRVSRVIPATPVARDLMRPLQSRNQSIKIVPAFSARVRYARPGLTPTNPAAIMSLDIDITSFAGRKITLQKVDVGLKEGLVDNLNLVEGMSLPMVCSPRDDVTFIYRLQPSNHDIIKSYIKAVDILITAQIDVSSRCHPLVSLRWTTSVDFTLPVNPEYANPAVPGGITRENRPGNLSITSSTFETIPTIASLAVTRPDALPSMEPITRHQRSHSVPDFGVTMTFTSPSTQPIPIHSIFTWHVFIVNRSDRPRKLGLVVLPRRRRPLDNRSTGHRPTSTSYGRDPKIASAVVDENILHAMQRNAAVEPAELICLSTDIRVGPLAPSSCHTVELKFRAMKSGVVGVDCVRVVDLGTQEHVDIRDLPSVVVHGGESNSENDEDDE